MSGFFSSLSRSLSEEVKAYTNAHPIRGRMLGASTNTANSDPMSDGEPAFRLLGRHLHFHSTMNVENDLVPVLSGVAEPKLEPVRVHPVDRSQSLPSHLVASGSISGNQRRIWVLWELAGAVLEAL